MRRKRLVFLMALAAFTVMAGAQTAHFRYFSYSGNDARFNVPLDTATQYFNPVLAGFYPDPSVCRKGDTYYMVNSSFSFFPGVPIFESRDLAGWRQIGHVLDRESQLPLDGQNVSGGIYAPAITYNERNKTFYMITTNVGKGNFFVKTKDPRKGWSEPIYLPQVGGIDPSFLFDKDGRGYIVNNDEPVGGHKYDGERSIMLHYFDVSGDSVIGEQIEIVRSGTHVERQPIWIEGPHLYHIGKYYYLMCAEGGTGDRHSEVVFRSRKPEGPWEECPYNPILTQRTGLSPDRTDCVTSTGHADMLQAADGSWWAVFLGCRPYGDDCYNTGRDTYLLPVTWKDGWPVILDKGKAVPTVNRKMRLPGRIYNNNVPVSQLTGNFSYTDSFPGDSLDRRWIFLRNPSPFYSLNGRGVSINAKPVNISQKKSPAAIFVRQQHTTFTAETEVAFAPSSERELAGMVLLQNEDYNFVFGTTVLEGRPAVTLARAEKSRVLVASAFLDAHDAGKPLRLKVEGHGRFYDFLYAVKDGEWQVLAQGVDAVNLSTHRSGGFIGACIGLYATTVN